VVKQKSETFSIRRILVPLDASTHSRAALEAATRLAAASGAEISGLYVEDVDLLEMCRYPFAREIGMFPARSRRLETGELEKDFRIQAEQIRQMMELLARDTAVKWSLTVRRGRVVAEIMEQIPTADLVVIGRLGRTLTGTSLGSTVRNLIEQGLGTALILKEGLQLLSPVITVYNGSKLSQQAISIAGRLAGAVDKKIEIFIPAHTEDKFEKLRSEILARVANDPGMPAEMQLKFRHIGTNVIQALFTLLSYEYRSPLVLPSDTLNGDAQSIQRLINHIDNPVLLVQSSPEA
jgi:nucleotide-binding universal stress UspA family protein